LTPIPPPGGQKCFASGPVCGDPADSRFPALWQKGGVFAKVHTIVRPRPRRWHAILADRLAAAGHDLAIIPAAAAGWPATTRAVLALERRLLHRGALSAAVDLPARSRPGAADLAVDLTGTAAATAPTLRLAFDGTVDDAAVPAALAGGRLPEIDIVLDGRGFGHAAPMVDNRVVMAAGADDVFARAITLAVAAVARYGAGDRATAPLADGRRYIFVEDYPHTTRKAVISVSALDDHGVAGPPVPVLEAPHHLSYPQIFARDGSLWMLPEGSGGGGLTLYRAERFPDRWTPAATLLGGEISDATLVEHDGALWLFATDRDGGLGSTSDTLVVYRAPTLLGPWTPHRRNPIRIDRRRARPGGGVIRHGSELLLPVQDGTDGYGAGLGLSRIVRLDADEVAVGEPRAVSGAGVFPYPQIHTLTRAGRLEVIDGIAAVRKR